MLEYQIRANLWVWMKIICFSEIQQQCFRYRYFVRRQAIIWSNDDSLLTWSDETTLNRIWIKCKLQQLSHMKQTPAKYQPNMAAPTAISSAVWEILFSGDARSSIAVLNIAPKSPWWFPRFNCHISHCRFKIVCLMRVYPFYIHLPFWHHHACISTYSAEKIESN